MSVHCVGNISQNERQASPNIVETITSGIQSIWRSHMHPITSNPQKPKHAIVNRRSGGDDSTQELFARINTMNAQKNAMYKVEIDTAPTTVIFGGCFFAGDFVRWTGRVVPVLSSSGFGSSGSYGFTIGHRPSNHRAMRVE